MMQTLTVRNLLIGILIFLSLGALIGGALLIISPSGKLIGGLPVEMLTGSPFHDFLFPGIILFIFIGCMPCITSYGLLRKSQNKIAERLSIFKDMHWAWCFTIYTAFALIIWIQVETIIIQKVSWLQTFYILYAILILIIALLPQLRKYYTLP